MSKPRVLAIDIETSLHTVKTFGLYNQNIRPEQIVKSSRLVCFAARFEGERKVHFYSEWTHTRKEMVKAAHELLDSADAVVTYNGASFDCKHLNREFVLAGLSEPCFQDIDLIKTVRKKFKFASNKLDYICKELGLDVKVPHTGIKLWMDIDDKCPKAQRLMKKYNIQDVIIMEQLYDTIKGWVVTQFNRALWMEPGVRVCPQCGSTNVTKRGKRKKRTKVSAYQRWECHSCGANPRSRLRDKDVPKPELVV